MVLGLIAHTDHDQLTPRRKAPVQASPSNSGKLPQAIPWARGVSCASAGSNWVRGVSGMSACSGRSRGRHKDGFDNIYEENTPQRIETFFDATGMLLRHSPQNWALATCLGSTLSKSKHVEMGHCSLSTRQQLKNTLRTLEIAKTRVEEQIKDSVEQQQDYLAVAGDAQRHRYLSLIFHPLREPPTDVKFQELLDDPPPTSTLEEDLERERELYKNKKGKISFKKGYNKAVVNVLPGSAQGKSAGNRPAAAASTGGAMSNQQRATLLTVFQRYVFRVSGPVKSSLMQRSTWFRFLLHAELLGARGVLVDEEGEYKPTITFETAAKIFLKYAEANSSPPVLTFSGWASATQYILKGPKFFDSQAEVVKGLFELVLPRTFMRVGLRPEDLLNTSPTRRMSFVAGVGRATTNVSRTMSLALANLETSSVGGSVLEGSVEDDRQPLPFQVTLAEEQMCEPEPLQLLHEFRPHLQLLFAHYSGCDVKMVSKSTMDHDAFKRMMDDIRFFPDFVQTYGLQRNLEISQSRCEDDEDGLTFSAFVECLVRICFLYLGTYGNSAQQAASSRLKCLWMLAQLHARLPRELLAAFGKKSGSEPPTPSASKVQGAIRSSASFRLRDELWHTRAKFDLSAHRLQELILWQTLHAENVGTLE